MDITDVVSEEYVTFPPGAPVSTLAGAFGDPTLGGVVVHGDEFEGVVTRKQLATSHHHPEEKVGSLVWHAPRVAPDEDVREVARLMVDGDTPLLPAFDGRDLVGVVTADDLLAAVEPYLDAATVAAAYTTDLVTVDPETTVGEALSVLRTNRIGHLPVVEDDTAVGMVSRHDLIDLTVRAASQSEGGDAGGTDSFGGEISASTGRAHGGFGAREGELSRVLDLPVRDVMVSPVRTIRPTATLEQAVGRMLAAEASSLVVTRDGQPFGILTRTDVLDALTWEAEGNRSVQVYGADLLDDVAYEDVVAMVEKFDRRDDGLAVLDAKIHLHEHDERLRGTPLVLARVRLHTDRGLFVASGEGYGASHAIHEARDVLERQLRDRKTDARSKKPPDEEFWEKRFGWLLEE
jgi:CBS domain-containing protein